MTVETEHVGTEQDTTQEPATIGHATQRVDPHEVRARITCRGSVNGIELDAGTGVVFIPQYALPDLRRRLLMAQERFTAMSGPVPGKRRRRPVSAR